MSNGSGQSILCLLATVAVGIAQSIQQSQCTSGTAATDCTCQCDQLSALAQAMSAVAAQPQPQLTAAQAHGEAGRQPPPQVRK